MTHLTGTVRSRAPSAAALALLGCGALLGPAGCTGGIDAGPTNGAVEQGASRFPRLTHTQWRNAARDLLRLETLPEVELNEGVTRGIFVSGAELTVSSTLWAQYQSAAEALALAATRTPDDVNRLLPDGLPTDATARARGFIEGFGLRAYRRPLTAEEVSAYETYFAAAGALYDSLDPFTAGVRHTITAMLQSPNFLYRIERSTTVNPDAPATVILDGYEIASRMSFGLWNSIPDDELFRAAAADELATEEGVREQAERMVELEAADAMLIDFHERLLGVNSYTQITRSSSVFPEYSEALRNVSMPGEVRHFLGDAILENDGGLRALMTSHFTYVDERLAAVYDVPGVTGDEFQRVELDPTERAGVLTMVGFLAANATSTETDPIHRGVFVNRRILCSSLPAPPNNVPPLPDPTDEPRTMRQRVDEHTGQGTCGASCHGTIINPIGFAYERFDALGRVQVTELGTMLPIDTASEFLFDEEVRAFDGAVELASTIAESPSAHRCYAGHLAEYLFGEHEVRRIIAANGGDVSMNDDAGARAVAVEIVANPYFRSRPSAPYTGPTATEE